MDKTVLLLIKAPLIELNDANENSLSVKVETIKTDGEWTEIEFTLPSGMKLYASKLTQEVKQYDLYKDKPLTISIHPQHIIVATLV